MEDATHNSWRRSWFGGEDKSSGRLLAEMRTGIPLLCSEKHDMIGSPEMLCNFFTVCAAIAGIIIFACFEDWRWSLTDHVVTLRQRNFLSAVKLSKIFPNKWWIHIKWCTSDVAYIHCRSFRFQPQFLLLCFMIVNHSKLYVKMHLRMLTFKHSLDWITFTK